MTIFYPKRVSIDCTIYRNDFNYQIKACFLHEAWESEKNEKKSFYISGQPLPIVNRMFRSSFGFANWYVNETERNCSDVHFQDIRSYLTYSLLNKWPIYGLSELYLWINNFLIGREYPIGCGQDFVRVSTRVLLACILWSTLPFSP